MKARPSSCFPGYGVLCQGKGYLWILGKGSLRQSCCFWKEPHIQVSYTGPLSITAGLALPPSSWLASTGLCCRVSRFCSNSQGHGQRRSPSNTQVPCEDCGVFPEQMTGDNQRRVSGYMGAVQGLKHLGPSIRNTRFKSRLHPRTGMAQRTALFGLACSLVGPRSEDSGLRRPVPSLHTDFSVPR